MQHANYKLTNFKCVKVELFIKTKIKEIYKVS